MTGRSRITACMILMLCVGLYAQTRASDWPQLQHDPQRTGFTPDEVAPPFKVAWSHNFQPERVSRFVQAIVYRGLVYVPTEMGNLYALSAEDGEVAWKRKLGGSVQHTVACADGKVIVAALGGKVHALDAATGAPVWTFAAPGRLRTFTQSPCIADGQVFIPCRQGILYALDVAGGKLLWETDLGVPVYQSAAYRDGTVYVGGEDIRMRAFDARDGRQLWASERLHGQSLMSYHPVVTGRFVLVRPMIPHPSRRYFNSNYSKDPEESLDYVFQATWDRPWLDLLQGKPLAPQAVEKHKCGELWAKTWPDVKAGRMPQVLLDAQEVVIEHYREHPYDQDFFVLNASDGQQAYIAPHFHCLSLPGPVCPPPVTADGTVVIPWIYISHMWARFDLERGRAVEIMCTPRGGNGDETVNVSVGGKYLYIMHCQEGNAQYTGVFNFEDKTWASLPRVQKRWWQMSDNCQSGNNAASIADGRFYHIVFHQLAAFTHDEGGEP